jgi:hypothetical protein
VRLGRANAAVWRMLEQRPDNETRSFLIHRFSELGANFGLRRAQSSEKLAYVGISFDLRSLNSSLVVSRVERRPAAGGRRARPGPHDSPA